MAGSGNAVLLKSFHGLEISDRGVRKNNLYYPDGCDS